MSLRDDLLPVVDQVRGIPGALGIRGTSVRVLRRTWSGGRRGSGTASDATVADLAAKYKVRLVTMREIASSGGKFEAGDVRVGPITPSDGGSVGYTPEELAPTGGSGDEIVHQLTGELAGEYRLVATDFAAALHYTLTLRRTRVTP